jgi:predicted nuclease of restriction endonuclease-like (RecB) superfamily
MDSPKDYTDFIGTIKNRIRNAQYAALKAVNAELVGLYWDIGKMISEKQKELGWGKSVVQEISIDLKSEFSSQKGFSTTNLWLMVQYYSEYQEDVFLQTLSGEIGFSHNALIFTKIKDRAKRIFYIKSVKKFAWSYRFLEHQITNQTYDKYHLNQTNYDQEFPGKYDYQKKLAIKDHYTFDFLELSEKHSELQYRTRITTASREGFAIC